MIMEIKMSTSPGSRTPNLTDAIWYFTDRSILVHLFIFGL